MAYKYYQPNEKGRKKMGDCIIRDLCKAYDLTWLEAFMKLKALRRAEQRKKEAPMLNKKEELK